MIWSNVRWVVVVLLVVAAGIKLSTVEDLLRSPGLLRTPEAIAAAIGFDLFAAAAIALTPPLIAHRMAVGTFSLLAVIAGGAWWTGTECGCFGSRTISGMPLLVDLITLTSLLAVTRSVSQVPVSRPLVSATGIPIALAFGIGLCGALTGSVVASSASEDAEMPMWFGEQMNGERFPLLKIPRVKKMTEHKEGTLFVLLRPECAHCREFAERWQAAPPKGMADRQIVSVSISPSRWTFMPGMVSARPIHTAGTFEMRWSEGSEPFVASPMLIGIFGEKVVEVVSGKGAVELLESEDGLQQLLVKSEI